MVKRPESLVLVMTAHPCRTDDLIGLFKGKIGRRSISKASQLTPFKQTELLWSMSIELTLISSVYRVRQVLTDSFQLLISLSFSILFQSIFDISYYLFIAILCTPSSLVQRRFMKLEQIS